MGFIRRICRGACYSEEYGHHPGWAPLVFLVISGLAFGGVRGAAIMGLLFGALFAVGCYSRGKSEKP